MNKKNKQWRSLNHVVGVISRCDVILKCKDELFVGLYYNQDDVIPPVVLCKGNWEFNFYITKIAEMAGIPCVDNQLLARTLYETVKEGDTIPEHYINVVAAVYAKLDKFSNPPDNTEFYDQLNEDALTKIYSLESWVYRRVEKKYFKNLDVCNQLYEGDVAKYFSEEIRVLAEENELNYRTLHNAVYKNDEFYLESYFEKYDLDFWQMVFVSQEDKKIYVGTKTLFKIFDFSEADIALGFVKALVNVWKGELWKEAQKFCDEFEINPRLYEIASNSIKTMVEMNYNQNGYEYGLTFDKTCAMIYLKKKEELVRDEKQKNGSVEGASKGPRMYEILITYNEFIRHPDVFKDFIKSPKKFKKWNFWCTERKYNPEMFEIKFQKENQPIEQ